MKKKTCTRTGRKYGAKIRKPFMEVKAPRGFTMPELLMVMLVMSVLLGALALMARGGLRAYAKAKREAQLIRNVTLGFELLRRDLVGAIYKDPATGTPLRGVNFLGETNTDSQGKPDDRIRFFSLLSPESTARGDLTSINYKKEVVNGVSRLGRATRGIGPAGVPPLVLDGVETFEPFLLHVTGFDSEYLTTARGSYQTSYNAQTAGKLPRAVRLRITVLMPDGKPRDFTHTVTLSMED